MSEQNYICTNPHCDDCGTEYPEAFLTKTAAGLACMKCKSVVTPAGSLLKSEVDQLLAKHGLNREDVGENPNTPSSILQKIQSYVRSTEADNDDQTITVEAEPVDDNDPMAVLHEANGHSPATDDPGPTWAEDLGNEYKPQEGGVAPAADTLQFEEIVSSNLDSAAFDPFGDAIVVRFKNGTQYRYEQCGVVLWYDFQTEFDGEGDHSAGKFLNAKIKVQPFTKLADWKVASPQPVASLNGVGTKIADKLVPEFGATLAKYQDGSLTKGFPPAVDALITKTGIDDTRAAMVLSSFQNAFTLAGQWSAKAFAIVVSDETQTAEIAEAKRLHKIIRDERINVEKTRAELKKPSLREGQLIDGVSNVYKDLLSPIEAHLQAQAQFVENLEKERKAEVAKDRAAKLLVFEFDSSQMVGLADMTDEAFETFYIGVREQYHTKKAAERKVEEERLERERQQILANDKLREENAKLEAERKAAAVREAEANRIATEEAAKAKAAQDELDRQAAQRKAVKDEAAAEAERRRLAPDKDKLLAFALEVEGLKIPAVDTKLTPFIGTIEADLGGIVDKIRGYAKTL